MNFLHVEGLQAQQSANVYKALEALVPHVDKKINVIELGTSNGGFTLILRKYFPEAIITTFDVKRRNDLTDPKFKQHNIKSHLVSCFDPEGEKLIASIIQEPIQCLLFCDNGNKHKEFNTFSNYLKKGDFIFAHDYICDARTFHAKFSGKIWNWHETWDEGIKDAVARNKLTPFLKPEFDYAVWASFKKCE